MQKLHNNLLIVGISLMCLVRAHAAISDRINSHFDVAAKGMSARIAVTEKRLNESFDISKKMIENMREWAKDVAQINASSDEKNICLSIPLRGSDELSRAIEPQKDARGYYLVIPFNSGEIAIRENSVFVLRRQQIASQEGVNEAVSENEYERGSEKRLAVSVSHGAFVGVKLPQVNLLAARIKRDTDCLRVTLPLKISLITVEDVRSQNNAE